ncbi:MAG: hypothetical protein HC875_33720 [Anaerolineales bacterium]|nr:hypothetical protein [Anaerolineales bacterium]
MIFWPASSGPAGDWSEAVNLSEGFDLISVLPPKLVRRPDGSVCAFWHGARVSRDPATIGLYMRCRSGEGWSEAEQVEARQVTARYDPKFTAAGALVSLYEVPPSSLKLADTELADGFKTVNGAALAVDQAGAFHAVWVRQGDPFSLEHRLSSDGGQSWSDPASLTDEATKPNGPFNLLADEQGNVHLVWAGFGKIFYRRWTPADGWGEVSELTGGQPGSGSTSLGLAVDSQGLAHVAWQGQNLSYVQQQPDGRWSAPQILAEALNSGPGPKVAVDAEGRRHFVWQVEDDAVDLYYATLPPP